MDNATYLSLTGPAAINGQVMEALSSNPTLSALLNDWTIPSFNPAASTVTYTSQALSTSTLVGQYVGSMTFPYYQRHIDTLLSYPLVYRDPYPTTFAKLQEYFLTQYNIQLDDGDFMVAGTSVPLIGTVPINATPDPVTGNVTLQATAQSIRFSAGSWFAILPINPDVPVPLSKLFTLDGDLFIGNLVDSFAN